MATTYESIVQKFFDRIEEDKKFFQYYSLDDATALELAISRAENYLNESVARIIMEAHPSVDWRDRDDLTKRFNFDLTDPEVYLLTSIMYEQYLNRFIAYLKTLSVNYTPTNIRVFDPSNARSTFRELYLLVQQENNYLLDVYRNTDRETGSYIGVNFSAYDESE